MEKIKPGRPSIRSITVRRGVNHHSVNFSQQLAKEENLQPDCKVEITKVGKAFYICFSNEIGANVRVKLNGKAKVKTFVASSTKIVNNLLNYADAEKVATFLIGRKRVVIGGMIWYNILPSISKF